MVLGKLLKGTSFSEHHMKISRGISMIFIALALHLRGIALSADFFLENDLADAMRDIKMADVLWMRMKDMEAGEILEIQRKMCEHLLKENAGQYEAHIIIRTFTKYPRAETGQTLRDMLESPTLGRYARNMILLSLSRIDPSDETAELYAEYISKYSSNYQFANTLMLLLINTNDKGRELAKTIVKDEVYPIAADDLLAIRIALGEIDESIADLRRMLNRDFIEEDDFSQWLFKAGSLISVICAELLNDANRAITETEDAFIREVRSIVHEIVQSGEPGNGNLEVAAEIIPALVHMASIDELRLLVLLKGNEDKRVASKAQSALSPFLE